MQPLIWKKNSQEEINKRVFSALERNIQYDREPILGVPASYLDAKVFYQDTAILKDAPFISTLVQNPNHIGCHTLGNSEPFFQGTQAIEKELLDICAVDILRGEQNQFDGYVASGGTEANLQAIWIYRNYFMQEKGATADDIFIMSSVDSHYSMDKAANVLGIAQYKVNVDFESRVIDPDALDRALQKAVSDGKKYAIVICNMMTTMYGSVDRTDTYIQRLEALEIEYMLHIDGAYGGFYYPFSNESSDLSFQNEKITSFTLDAHKMAQAPYGTGIFIIKKGFMPYAGTKEATYVKGNDYTLIGSRSGANAVATWMILVKNGPYGWTEKVLILQNRTDWMCKQLDNLSLQYYRHPHANIIAIRSVCISDVVAEKFGLVPNDHENPSWYKLVIMEHVTIEKLKMLLDDIEQSGRRSTLERLELMN